MKVGIVVLNALVTKNFKVRRVKVCQKTQKIDYLSQEQKQVQSDDRKALAWRCITTILNKAPRLPLFQNTSLRNNRKIQKEKTKSLSRSRTIRQFLSDRLASKAYSM